MGRPVSHTEGRRQMIILIHTSKTMRAAPSEPKRPSGRRLTVPVLVRQATELAGHARALSPEQIERVMAVSPPLAAKTRESFAAWNTDPASQTPAVESFVGDIYSGLRAGEFTTAEKTFASRHLRILSGLYGILRPYDGICPYRLEMGYRLPDPRVGDLYTYWGSAIAEQLPATGVIVNLTAVEYGRTVTRHVDPTRMVAPKFLTTDPKSGTPKFVAVHAKIARGAFARWLITTRAADSADLTRFDDLGYRHSPELSGDREPCFVCTEFGGTGLSVRLT